jgi:diguanylate cyclase (GGDEF)-like protein
VTDDWDDSTSAAEAPGERRTGDARACLVVLQGTNVGETYQVGGNEIVIGRAAEADIRLDDDGVSRAHCKLRVRDGVVEVEDLGSRNGTFCNGARIAAVQTLHEGDKLQIGETTILRFTLHDEVDESFQRRIFEAALRDGLTGAYNKRYLVDRLHGELKFAIRHRAPLSVALFDLDHFKKINDVHGHLVGDRVLAAFAERVLGAIRHEDVFARFGGEEFALLSRAISPADMARLAERLRKTTESLEIRTLPGVVRVTTSVGVANLDDLGTQTAEDLLEAADRALYQAKHQGRNRVVVCDRAMLEARAVSRGRMTDPQT